MLKNGLFIFESIKRLQQVCIPVGYVPPACCRGRVGLLRVGCLPLVLGVGVSASGSGGGCLPLVQGSVSASGPGGSASGPKGVCLWSGEVCLLSLGMDPSMHWGRQPPPGDQNDRQV